MTCCNAHAVPAAPPAPPPPPPPVAVRRAGDPSTAFAGVSALAATFAGFLSYSGEPDALAAGLAAGITFLGALFALHVLHFVFRVTMMVGKFAIPVAAILMIGCALDWPWAETSVDLIAAGWSRGVEFAGQGWSAWQAR